MSSQTPNELTAVIKGYTDGALQNVHTALPGTVVSYEASSGKASVQPAGKWKGDDGQEVAYPVIHNVPVLFPCGAGGAAGMTFPLHAGDGCLLVFSESQTDDFLSDSDVSEDPRRHDLNDAICLPGLYNRPVAGNTFPSDVCVYNGGCMMRVGAGGITVTGGDLVVNGISVTHHKHRGDSGGTTGEPQ